ncbi:unnamed protein product, partial [Mesorhabditis spiculigera]
MLPSLLLLMVTILPPLRAVICWQCGGAPYSAGVRVLYSTCCRPERRVCEPGLTCLRATVDAPNLKFILSGCHPPEDGLVGCETHPIPHFNATLRRCVCLDERCQRDFPKPSKDCGPTPSVPYPKVDPDDNLFTNLINNIEESDEKRTENSVEFRSSEEEYRSLREREKPAKTPNHERASSERGYQPSPVQSPSYYRKTTTNEKLASRTTDRDFV